MTDFPYVEPAWAGFPFDLNPYDRDPVKWASSMLHSAEIVLGCLNAVNAHTVAEIGAYKGELTRLLLRWAETADATILAIDPYPHADLQTLSSQHPELQLIRELSLDALPHLPRCDAIILDGDHNYYTLTHELTIIEQRATEQHQRLPLLLAHDVSWPHGRRDDYWDPDQIPPEHRHPIEPERHLQPDELGTQPSGLLYHHPAEHEGGPRNGVLTAAEDFTAQHAHLHLAVIPAFFGIGVIYDTRSPHADALHTLLDPWDRNPLLQRLEHNRVVHFAVAQHYYQQTDHVRRRLAEQRRLLKRMLDSQMFALAESILRLRHQDPIVSREKIRELLDEPSDRHDWQ